VQNAVEAAWVIAHRAGAPLAGARSGPAPSQSVLADAVRTLVSAGALSPREREALGALLLAWRDHWARAFAASFGADAVRLSEWADAATPDANRRIKLRRIALESLATVL
jgi:hypothetical protein